MTMGPNMGHKAGHQERGQFPIDTYRYFKQKSGEQSRVTWSSFYYVITWYDIIVLYPSNHKRSFTGVIILGQKGYDMLYL